MFNQRGLRICVECRRFKKWTIFVHLTDRYTTPNLSTHAINPVCLFIFVFSLKSSISEDYASAWSADSKTKKMKRTVLVYLTNIHTNHKLPTETHKPCRLCLSVWKVTSAKTTPQRGVPTPPSPSARFSTRTRPARTSTGSWHTR